VIEQKDQYPDQISGGQKQRFAKGQLKEKIMKRKCGSG